MIVFWANLKFAAKNKTIFTLAATNQSARQSLSPQFDSDKSNTIDTFVCLLHFALFLFLIALTVEHKSGAFHSWPTKEKHTKTYEPASSIAHQLIAHRKVASATLPSL